MLPFRKYVKGLTNLFNVSDKNWQISQTEDAEQVSLLSSPRKPEF